MSFSRNIFWLVGCLVLPVFRAGDYYVITPTPVGLVETYMDDNTVRVGNEIIDLPSNVLHFVSAEKKSNLLFLHFETTDDLNVITV